MGQNNDNGYPAKVDLQLDQQVQLRIIRPVKTGTNGKNPFYLYRVVDVQTGEEKSFFAEAGIHSIIEEKRLGVGSEFLLKRVANGKKGSYLELSILGKEPEKQPSASDNLKELLFQSIRDAVEVVRDSGIQFSNEEISKLSVTMFIQRSRAY